MLTPYIPELVKCIADSLARSQPPAQLARAFAAAIQRPPINPPQVQSVSHLIQKSSASQPPIQRLPIPKPSPRVPLAELNHQTFGDGQGNAILKPQMTTGKNVSLYRSLPTVKIDLNGFVRMTHNGSRGSQRARSGSVSIEGSMEYVLLRL